MVEQLTLNRNRKKRKEMADVLSCLAQYRYIIIFSPFQLSSSKEQSCPTAFPETVNRLAKHCGGDGSHFAAIQQLLLQ